MTFNNKVYAYQNTILLISTPKLKLFLILKDIKSALLGL